MDGLALVDIARMEERRQADGLFEVADEAKRLGGGTLARGVPGTWFNYGVGLGLSGPVSAEDLREFVEFYEGKGIEPRIEVCPFADEAFVADLASMGFVVRLFEMVFARALDAAEPVRPVHTPPAGLEIRAVDREDHAQVDEYVRVTTSGFMPGVWPIPQEFLDPGIACVKHRRTIAAGAWIDGRLVGGGVIFMNSEAASLAGLSVREEYRRQGVQQALIAWRLNEAARRGCRIATIGSKPGQATERNVRRMGFSLAYTKVTMVRPRAGLVAMRG